MKRIALYDVDSKIPNLALMKISAYHKQLGDQVESYLPLMIDQYDRIYASKIFSDSDGTGLNVGRMWIGGTGWNLERTLPEEIEAMDPDYTFYGFDHSLGFTMRGCRFNCSFCVVPEKEGKPKSNNTINEIWTNRSSDFLILLDNDFFGNPEWQDRIDEIKEYNLRVCFSQGLNIRIITKAQAESLVDLRFRNLKATKKQMHFAWDRIKDEQKIIRGINTCLNAGLLPNQMAFFVLIGYDSTQDEDYHRVMLLRNMGCDPYVMPYNRNDHYQRRFARWVNHKAIFKSVEWKNYK